MIGLNLKGGTGETRAAACAIPHHYTQYRAGDRIYFDGSVTSPPRGRWKVKVKLRSCVSGVFQDAGSAPVHVRHDETFKGSFRGPVPGYYFARASLNARGRRVARSSKQFFQVR